MESKNTRNILMIVDLYTIFTIKLPFYLLVQVIESINKYNAGFHVNIGQFTLIHLTDF